MLNLVNFFACFDPNGAVSNLELTGSRPLRVLRPIVCSAPYSYRVYVQSNLVARRNGPD